MIASFDKVENLDREREVFNKAIPQTLFLGIRGRPPFAARGPEVIAAACRNMSDALTAR